MRSMQIPSPRPALRARLGAKLCLSLGVLALLLGLLEGGVRLRQRLRYGTFGAIHELETDRATGLEMPLPGRQTATISHNSLGFRGPEPAPPSDEVIRIAFLGASTTYCAEVSGEAATWPCLVVALLAERFAPQRFDYVNAGVPAWTAAESRKSLELQVAPLEPDVIVIYHATNDLTRNSRQLAVEQGVYRGHADQTSWLGEHSLAWYLVEKNLLLRRRTAAARSGEGRLQLDPQRLAAPFERDLEALVASARAHSERVSLVTFSHRARREQSPEEQQAACVTSFYYMPYMTAEGLIEAFEVYNEVIRDVAARTDSLLIEAAHEIPGNAEHFHDSVHFRDAGSALLARIVVEGLAQDPGFLGLLGP
jgi:lysophospholipase L1-like esterase